MNNIENKVILITGAASGLGYKYAEQMLVHGAKAVAIMDLSTSPGPTSAATLEKKFGKGRVMFLPCDVTNEALFKESFNKVVATFNGLDILINNAGILNDKQIELTININVTSLIRCTLVALDYMGKHKGGKGGTIVNIASIVGLTPYTGAAVYSASKHAVIGFSRSVQDFYDKTGVRTLVLCPGVTTTALLRDITDKLLDFVDQEKTLKDLSEFPTQTVDSVAAAMVSLIQKGKNGAVWVAEGSEPPYGIEFVHYTKLAVPV